MSEKIYTILISCIACLLALVLAMCSVIVSHAEEAETMDIDYLWYQSGEKCGTELSTSYSYDAWKSATSKKVSFPVLASSLVKSNVCHHSWWGTGNMYSGTFTADSEIVAYVDTGLTADKLDASGIYLSGNYKSSIESNSDYWKKALAGGLVSKSQIVYQYYKNNKSSSGVYECGNLSSTIYSDSYSYAGNKYYLADVFRPYCDNYDFGFYADVKLFDSYKSATEYLTSGDLGGLVVDGSVPKQTYSSELAFASFDMSVHDSNSFDDYYIDFLYRCPESWLGKDVKLLVNQTWDYNVYYFDIKEACNPISLQGANQSPLSISDTSIRFYLKDFKCFDELLSHNVLAATSSLQKRSILGEGNFSESFSLGGVPIKGSASTVVDKSLLSLSCVVYVDGVAGHEYVGSVDLITGDNSMATYTPDSSGNYTFNDDYKKGGHYYTNVGKDAAGNTTYNYYYYGTDGSKKDVSANDAANNTVSNTIQEGAIQNNNNPTFTNNNNITVEGDTINNDVNNYVGNNTSSETNKNFIEKFLGFFQVLENNSFLGVWGKVFGWLPPGISSVITTALGIGACVGLFKFFRK